MAPGGAEPLDTAAIIVILRQRPQRIDHVTSAHLLESMQQTPRVIQHDPRLRPFAQHLRNQIAHATIALQEDRRVVSVGNLRMLHHELQIADDAGGLKIRAPRRNQRLVHVKGDAESTVDATEVDAALAKEDGGRAGNVLPDFMLSCAKVRKLADGLREDLAGHLVLSLLLPSLRLGSSETAATATDHPTDPSQMHCEVFPARGRGGKIKPWKRLP